MICFDLHTLELVIWKSLIDDGSILFQVFQTIASLEPCSDKTTLETTNYIMALQNVNIL